LPVILNLRLRRKLYSKKKIFKQLLCWKLFKTKKKINTNKKNNISRNSNPSKMIEADLTTKFIRPKDKIEEVGDKTVNEI
jgi:hypothetical protein